MLVNVASTCWPLPMFMYVCVCVGVCVRIMTLVVFPLHGRAWEGCRWGMACVTVCFCVRVLLGWHCKLTWWLCLIFVKHRQHYISPTNLFAHVCVCVCLWVCWCVFVGHACVWLCNLRICLLKWLCNAQLRHNKLQQLQASKSEVGSS